MAAPAGASAGASASFEQAAVAMVRPPITASMEASLDFFMGQTPSSLSDTQNVPLHPAASGRQAKPGRMIPASGVRGIGPSERDGAEPAIHAEGPTPSRHNSAKGSDRLHETMVFLAPGGAASFGGRPEGRRGPGRRGRGCVRRPCPAVTKPGGTGGNWADRAVRRQRTMRATRSQRRAQYGRCGSSSSKSPWR